MATKEPKQKIKSFADIAEDPVLGGGANALYGSTGTVALEDIKNSSRPRHGKKNLQPLVLLPTLNSGVSPAEERFCQEYIKTGELWSSYIKAGLVPTDAPERRLKYLKTQGVRGFFYKKSVQTRLHELLAAEKIRLQLTPDSIAEKMLKVYERAMQIDDLRNANTTLENLAKYLGMFQNHTIVNVQNNTQINTVALDDNQLEDHIQSLIKAATAERLEKANIPELIDVTPNQSG